jgi:hypothetical protein
MLGLCLTLHTASQANCLARHGDKYVAPVKDYFQLQFTMTNRKFTEFGVHPALGYLLVVAGFGLFIAYVFSRTVYAPYVVVLAAASVLLGRMDKNRSEFLTMLYGDQQSRRVQLLENLLLALPFAVVLVGSRSLVEAVTVLPTPFAKIPFEFPMGFRKTFLAFPALYTLAGIAIVADNPYLGGFAVLLVYVVCLTYYALPEPVYWVWMHSLSPGAFLQRKLKTASVYATLLAMPPLLLLGAIYPQQAGALLLFALAGLAFLWTIVLAKYAVYPGEMNVAQSILIALSISFPPLLLALIPFFYVKSIHNLKHILHD